MSGTFDRISDLVSYRTNKQVVIRDRVLGILNIVCISSIAIYIGVWKIGFDKAYLEYEPVSGNIKLDLAGSTPSINLLEEEYCRAMKCRLCDSHDVRYPNIDTRELLVTTYVREARQQRVCRRNATECPFKSPFQTVLWDDYLVAGVEYFQMRLDHSVQAPNFLAATQNSKMFRGNSRQMYGRLVGMRDGQVRTLKEFPPNGQMDMMTIREILAAAQVDIDRELPGHIRPVRETGIVVYCRIRYFNDYTLLAPAPAVRYEYEFLSGSSVESVYEPVHLGVAWTSPVDVEERMMLTRRGIKLVWTQEGALGKFSFSALMIAVAVGLAMARVVQLVLDTVAVTLVPMRKVYRSAITDEASPGNDRPAGGPFREYGALGTADPYAPP